MTEPTVVQLRAFSAVARARHFGDAADDLAVTQPAVSAAIATLEATLGVKLFERSSHGVLLTPAGLQLLPTARRVLTTIDEIVQSADGERGPHRGPLRLGVIPTVAPYLLPTVLEALERRLPRLVPEVTEGTTRTLLSAMEVGELDLVVIALPSDAGDVVELPLYWEEFVLLVHEEHPLAGADGLPTSSLRGLDILLLDEGHCMRDQAIDVCRLAGAATGHASKAVSLTTISQLVAARLGVTLLPATAVPVEVRGPLATAHFESTSLPGRRVGLAHRRSSVKAVELEELAEVLRDEIAAAALPVRIERRLRRVADTPARAS